MIIKLYVLTYTIVNTYIIFIFSFNNSISNFECQVYIICNTYFTVQLANYIGILSIGNQRLRLIQNVHNFTRALFLFLICD